MNITPVANWILGETVDVEGNLKFAPLTVWGGPIILSLTGIAPFEPSSWGDKPTKNLDIRLDGPTEEKLTCMQACISEKFSLPKYQENAFKTFLNKNGEFPANIRFKLGGVSGLTGTRYWDHDKKLLSKPPQHYSGATWDCKILLKGVWYSDEYWGISLQATDMMRTQAPPIPECPF